MNHQKMLKMTAIISTTLAVVLTLAKFAGFCLTGSLALLATAVESSTDIVASLIATIGIKYTTRHADDNFRFGYGKAEAVSTIVQSTFIATISMVLTIEAIKGLFQCNEVSHGGILILTVTTLTNLLIVAAMQWVVHRTGSTIIQAEKAHYQGDAFLDTGVIASLLVYQRFGVTWVDPLIALCIGLWLIWNMLDLIFNAAQMLMDREISAEDRHRIVSIATAHPEADSVHAVRTRQSGSTQFINFHIELNGNVPLNDAHRIHDEIQDMIWKEFPNTDIVIHLDPAGHNDTVDYSRVYKK